MTRSKVCLVTGGTSGVGRSIAKALARSGATVVLVSRDSARGAAAAESLRGETGNDHVDSIAADLSSMDSIRELAAAIRKKYDALHVLSNNAALLVTKRQVTRDGLEAIFATTYLGHFLLTNLLTDMLKEGAPSRVLTVAGMAGGIARLHPDYDDWPGTRKWSPLRATLGAALAKVLFGLELARRLEGTGVTSNVFHPGIVRSALPSHLPLLLRIPLSLVSVFSAAESATGCFLAVSADVEGVTGKFFSNRKIVPFTPSYDIREAGRSLWDASARMSGLV